MVDDLGGLQVSFVDLPVVAALEGILAALLTRDIGRVLLLERRAHGACVELWPPLATRRGFPSGCSLQRAHLVENADFFDPMDDPEIWWRGPNSMVQGNVLERDSHGRWLWLSGGTDYTGFQGGFRQVAGDVGLRPIWVSFRVQVATPDLSCAFLALAAGTHTWGLEDVVVLFNYRGDDRRDHQRCFAVETKAAQHGGSPHFCKVKPEVLRDRPYDVSFRLDWVGGPPGMGLLSVYIDGVEHVRDAEFNASLSVRIVAMHNWRSAARAAFSELSMGPGLPCSVPPQARLTDHGRNGFWGCSRRCRALWTKPSPLSSAASVRHLATCLTALAVLVCAYSMGPKLFVQNEL